MAKVYLSLVTSKGGVNKLMVVKVLKKDVLQGAEDGLEVFWDEARLATRLQHPNIVHTYEVGEIDGNYFLAMEYLDGQMYRVVQARASDARLPLADELRILSETARGLHYAHELKDFRGVPLGVVHRDISPQNVFVTYEGQVKLIDFGIAKTHDASHETSAGLIKGKLNYIAPEQLRGDALDRRADIFALGVMLWEAVAGRRFTAHLSEVAKVHARITGDEPNIRVVKPEVSEALAAIIDRALALDREQRWADAQSFADALDAYIESTGQHPSIKGLASRMQSLFAQEHTSMRQIIDARVQAILERTSDDVLEDIPSLPVPEEALLHSGTQSASATRASTSGTRASAGSDSQPVEVTGIRHAWAALGQPLQRRVGLGLLIVAAAAAVALLRPGTQSSAAAVGPAAASHGASVATAQLAAAPGVVPVASAADAPAEPQQVTLSLVVSPTDAHVAIDGAPLDAPFSGAFPRSKALHRIEVTAAGYRPFARLLPFDRDHSVEVTLEPEAQADNSNSNSNGKRNSAARARADRRTVVVGLAANQDVRAVPNEEPRRPATLAPGADIPVAGGTLGRSEIDTSNPYAN
ncbi:MAG: protein kinase [Myxococcaceae bacterium]|nr:protein kinase [Myxococcaceae bacterium]